MAGDELSYATCSTEHITAANGVAYAYRRIGRGSRPLVLLQHFRGNLDNWDAALIDLLATSHEVVAFDNTGVGASSGLTPRTVQQMAFDALEFLDALELDEVDVLGFSLGSFVAQELAFTRPNMVRRLVLAASAPQGAPGMHGWDPGVISAVGGREPNPSGYLDVFYTRSAESRAAGAASMQRIFGTRTQDRDPPTSWQTRMAQYDAVCAWGIPDTSRLARLAGIEMPVLVANGDSDPMIRTRYSYLLAGLLPDARLTIYPDAAHGFLFQRHEEFAAEVVAFLSEER
jgi:pimeloyl-ACP methyl ester carboxylesterase